MNFKLRRASFLLGTLLLSSVFLASCQFFKKESATTPAEPPKIWKVEKDVASTPYYDGICGKADEYIVLKYP